MKLIIAAQNYGFCPTSYAFTIARAVRNSRPDIDISIVETPSVKTFNQLNQDISLRVIPTVTSEADLVISCYEPTAILEAWLNNIPCIYYCNLLWFWLRNGEVNIKQLETDIRFFSQLKKENKHEEIRELFTKKCQEYPISGMMYGYLLADRSFCRKYPGYEAALVNLPPSIATKIKAISIFMPYQKSELKLRSNIVLFQLSGSESPHVNLKQNEIYIRGCYQLALTLSQQHADKHFIFCANPNILAKLSPALESTRNLEIRGSVSQQEQFSLLSRVNALFVPPGLGTTYEALYCGTPLFYLPEQNIGQHPNWKMLKDMGIEIPACLANEEFPDTEYSISESSVDNLFQRILLLFQTRMDYMANLSHFFLNEQVPNWADIHQEHLAKFKKVMGEKPFLVGNDIARIFLDIIPVLKFKLPSTKITLMPFSEKRKLEESNSPSFHLIARL